MPVTIIKADKLGRPSMIADKDLYLDESQKKVIVVEGGQNVPAEAAFILAMKGSWVPKEHEEKVKALGEVAVKVEPQAQPEAQVSPELPRLEPPPAPQQVDVAPESVKEKAKK